MKRLLALIPVLIMATFLIACNTHKNENGVALSTPIDLTEIHVVLPAEADRHVHYAADSFINSFKRLAKIEVASSTAEQDLEILIGNTGRNESNTLKATLGKDEFAIKLMGKKLVVVATDDAFLYEAVQTLLRFIKNSTNADVINGKITLKRKIDVKQTGNKESFVYLFSKTDTVSAQGEIHNTFDEFHQTIAGCQGGCIANGSFYQSLVWHDGKNQANNNVIIAKYDFEKKTKITQSKILPLNHCNDLTYHAEQHLIVAANNTPHANLVTFLDPNTLQIVRTQRIAPAIYALTYCYERNAYMVGIAGSQNLRRLNGNLQYDSTGPQIIRATHKTAGYTTQGICSDENFIYCVFFGTWDTTTAKYQNVISVYDWYGNFVGIIHIDVTLLEPENISIIDGTLYVSCHTNYGARVFKMNVQS